MSAHCKLLIKDHIKVDILLKHPKRVQNIATY